MMKRTLVPGLNPNINDNKEHNISEELSNNNNKKKSTGFLDVFEESSEESDPFIEPYIDLPKVMEEEDDNSNQQQESSISNTSKTIATHIAK
jgi:hypothetical protein